MSLSSEYASSLSSALKFICEEKENIDPETGRISWMSHAEERKNKKTKKTNSKSSNKASGFRHLSSISCGCTLRDDNIIDTAISTSDMT